MMILTGEPNTFRLQPLLQIGRALELNRVVELPTLPSASKIKTEGAATVLAKLTVPLKRTKRSNNSSSQVVFFLPRSWKRIEVGW